MNKRARVTGERREAVKALVARHKMLAEVEAALPEPDATPMFPDLYSHRP